MLTIPQLVVLLTSEFRSPILEQPGLLTIVCIAGEKQLMVIENITERNGGLCYKYAARNVADTAVQDIGIQFELDFIRLHKFLVRF